MRGSGPARHTFFAAQRKNSIPSARICCACEHTPLRHDQVAQSQGRWRNDVRYTLQLTCR
jgi:hypothetical protein